MMKNEFTKELYKWALAIDPSYITQEEFYAKMDNPSFAKSFYEWALNEDPSYSVDLPLQDFYKKVGLSSFKDIEESSSYPSKLKEKVKAYNAAVGPNPTMSELSEENQNEFNDIKNKKARIDTNDKFNMSE